MASYGSVGSSAAVPHAREADGERRYTAWRRWPAIAIGLAGVITVNYMGSNGSALLRHTGLASTDDSSTKAPALSVSNDYERNVLGHHIADGLWWDHLVQRYQPTTIEIETDCSASWTVLNPDGTTEATYVGTSFVVEFSHLGMHTLELELDCDGTSSQDSSFSYSVMSKHVRYEVRTLSKEDREDFLDALVVVYNTNQKDGEAKYGSKFRSIEFLVREHLYGAAAKDCDHWHDDAGILTHHMAFTLELEQSLQAIQPTISMPYWDYTIDSYVYSASTWTNSSIFDNNWFGAVDDGGADYVITEGRWAYQTVMQNAQDWSGIHNPYGLLRSPWNTNPTPYITRSRYTYGVKDGGWTIPDCTNFHETADVEWIGDLFSSLNGELHGPIHIMIGGQWDFADASFNMSHAVSAESAKQMSDVFLLASKYLWRQGYLRCPESCSSDTPVDECQCSCPYTKDYSDDEALEFMRDRGLVDMAALLGEDTFVGDAGFTGFKELLDLVCHVGHAGEMFTSAAPYDPTFWPLHGVAERFLSYKRIAAEWGITTINETWGYRHGKVMSDTHVVCDWDSVAHKSGGVESMELPACTKGVTCSGHRADDILPMGDFLGNGDTYSNVEWYNFTRPWNEDLPYVYDSYSSWPGCSEQGIFFFESASHSQPEGATQADAASVGGVAGHVAAGRLRPGFANDRRLVGLSNHRL
mmetsp:Transcript_73800/g.210475  ORF Transcript_73800/g.210475 Transcript_73800/m.210475 type:complete len:697 (-) Transcript_73800:230-2320(-)